MPLDSWLGYFLKLSPTPLSFTVVRFWEPNTLVGRKEQFRGTHSAWHRMLRPSPRTHSGEGQHPLEKMLTPTPTLG